MQEKAYAIGCAIVKQTKADSNTQLMACNYAITNFLYQPVYTIATEAGAKCETGKHKKYPNLCSAKEKYKL